MTRSILPKIGIGLVLILIGIQFVPVDRTAENAEPSMDFLTQNPTAPAAETLKAACYDCHSNETEYPFYASIAPVSWYIQKHINHGREHLNFSTWTSYSVDDREHILEEMVEEIEENKMPLKSYRLLHGEARLSDAEKEQLTDWLASL